MLKYDYIIKRNEGDEIREYKPDLIPKELADVVYIEGPNSSGKSTLLNLIALGFFGLKLKDDELNLALRERLNNLINSKHQEIKFNIELNNIKLSSIIKTIKTKFDSKDFQVRIKSEGKERLIGAEKFHKEFKLIYDIPSNPLERLPQLLTEIKSAQILRGNQVDMLGDYIKKIIDEILDSKNPNQISELKKKKKEQEKEYIKIKSDLERENNFFNGFQRFFYTKTYLEYLDMLKKVKEEIKEIKKTKIEIKEEERIQSKQVEALIKKIRENRESAEKFYFKASNYLKNIIPNSERHHLHIWLDSKCSDEIENPEVNCSLRQEADYFIRYLPDLLQESDEKKVLEANFFKCLLKVLIEYSHTEITIPETNKNISEFKDILEEKVLKYEKILTKNENIKECIRLINEMQDKIESAINETKECRDNIDKQGKIIGKIKEDTSKDKLKQLKGQKSFYDEKIKYIEKELAKIDIDKSEAEIILSTIRYKKEYDAYEVYTENQLFEKWKNQKDKVNKIKENKERQKRIIANTISEINRLEKKKPHKYLEYLSKLEELYRLVQNLGKKLTVTFDEYIKITINKEKQYDDLEEHEQKYVDRVGEFLAKKVRYIKHIKHNYLVNKIDVLNEEIVTENKKIIKFKDIGTGQSQAAYLSGLLSMEDNRKIIALFDEVAMMDSTTMEPILEKFKSLYNDNKLLLGIIVQKADKMKVKNLV
ncbi:MAG: hypothetical protein ACTSUT_13670 [Promethearchaeota archaeon]